MKLNYDCIRDVLLTLEENLTLSEELQFNSLTLDDLLKFEQIKDYSKQDLAYTLHNLDEIGFIETHIGRASGGIIYYIEVYDITYYGHEFLSSIRPTSNWVKIKSTLTKLGTASIPIISEIANRVITSAL
ncbi:DUF2513 domain-containing protein [Peptoanaerobacter stomatis]|uniref:DUF2513 domain-containing protein n=1 Tax=Peptoanaerobacter stomatis TaxID=796937 RepID=UPI003FA0035E